MDLKQLSRADIEERLKDRSNKQLVTFASDQGLRLPTGLNNRAAILDAIHGALSAKPSAPSSASTSTPGAAPQDPLSGAEDGQRLPLEPEPTIMVLCITKHAKGIWRFGHHFTSDWQDVPISTFDEATWRKIRLDVKFLRSRGFPPGFAEV